MPTNLVWFRAGYVVRATREGGHPVDLKLKTSKHTLTGAGEVVAVFDTGLDSGLDGHKGKTLRNFDAKTIVFSTLSQDDYDTKGVPTNHKYIDVIGHGTHVAGTIAHCTSGGPRGVARGAELLIQFELSDPSWFEKNLDDAYANGARIHNNSWGDKAFMITEWKCNASLNKPMWTDFKSTKTKSFYVEVAPNSAKGFKPALPNQLGRKDGPKEWTPTLWRLGARYGAASVVADTTAAKYRDLVIVAGAGNEYDDNAIFSPGTAKNVITVGSTRNDIPEAKDAPGWIGGKLTGEGLGVPGDKDNPLHPDRISAFSNGGPTDDGRIKPDVLAPGEAILAPLSQNWDPSRNQVRHGSEGEPKEKYRSRQQEGLERDYGPFGYSSGTSMATPVVSGCVALLREWLREACKLTAPSSSLVKALLINGATRLPSSTWGAPRHGWGRVNLGNIIDPSGGRYLRWSDEEYALEEDKKAVFELDLAGWNPQSIKITLVWIDPPGKEMKTPDDKVLSNALDLHVQAPTREWYAGNIFNDQHTSKAHKNPQAGDSVNNVKCVILDGIDHRRDKTALYTIVIEPKTLKGLSVAEAVLGKVSGKFAQSFALVVSGVPSYEQLRGKIV